MKISDYIMEFLASHGIKHVFMLAGGGSMHLVDSLGRNKDLEYVCCLHEQAAAFAAEAYAEYSGNPSAVLVTTGPGGTNALTGVAAAWMESSPVIFISGQVKTSDMLTKSKVRSRGPQELDIVSIVRPITKYAATITDPKQIRFDLELAWACATSGRRGPVWLDIPLDVQAADIDPDALEAPHISYARSSNLFRDIELVIDALKQAKRPVLFIGNGARCSQFETLVNLLKIPTLLTWKAMDLLPEDHPYYSGRPGAIASRGANFTQQNADLIIVVGARLDMPQVAFSHKNFAREAKKIIVDVDNYELSKFDIPINVSICEDAKDFVKMLLEKLEGFTLPDTSKWLKTAKAWKKRYPVILPEYWKEEKVNTYVLADVLSELCTKDDVFAPGSSGACSDIFLQSFRVKKGQRVVNAPSLGAMGTGLPGSIGFCLASGRKRTICVNGDGGFQLNIQDLETVRRLDLPIKYFILCNGEYASISNMQKSHFKGNLVGSDPSSGLTLPDVRQVAEAYGIRSMEIRSHKNIHKSVAAVLFCDGPVVCAVYTSPDQQTLPRATSSIREDGTIVSLPMEDMAPRLPRDEFRKNMMIPMADEEI
jgi:acetolactate synthase-1/2/3 large subunit